MDKKAAAFVNAVVDRRNLTGHAPVWFWNEIDRHRAEFLASSTGSVLEVYPGEGRYYTYNVLLADQKSCHLGLFVHGGGEVEVVNVHFDF